MANNIKYYRPSLFRLLTNYTLNVILILLLILTIPIYFQGNLDKFLVPNITLEIGLISGLIITTILGFNTTILSISNKSLTYQSALIKDKIINIEFKNIDHINESGYDLIIYTKDNKKIKIELIKNMMS